MVKNLKKSCKNDRRARIERDTVAYFARLRGKASREEARLEAAVSSLVDEINFDR